MMELKQISAGEIKSIVESLQEGIVVVQNEKMVYQNKIYEQFQNQDDDNKDAIEKLDIKMFKMQKNIEESANQK